MESALQRLPPGQETVLGIFDFQGAGPQNIDLDFARFLVSHLHMARCDRPVILYEWLALLTR